MKKRIFLSILTLCLLLVVIVIFINTKLVYNSNIQQQGLQMQNTAIKYSLKFENRQQAINLLKSQSLNYYRISYIAKNGEILFDSDENIALMDNHSKREEFLKAQADTKGFATRVSNTMGEEYHYFAMLVNGGDVLRLSFTSKTILATVNLTLQKMLLLAVLIVVLSAFLASVIANFIVKPLNLIVENTQSPIKDYKELLPFQNKINLLKSALEQRAIEAENKSREIQTITNNMLEGLIILDSSMNILSFNNSAKELLGKIEPLYNIYSISHSENFINAIKNLSTGQQQTSIVEIEDKNISIHASAVINQNILSGYVLLLVDISREKQNEKSRKEFSANVSHELKTPLTAIMGYADIMQNGIAKNKDMPKFAGKIYKESQRLLVLIEDIMRLSSLDEGQGMSLADNVDLFELSKEVINLHKAKAKVNNIKLSLAGSKVNIKGNKQLLFEMINNLVDNAIKYNVQNGNVSICISDNKNQILLKISDTGCGIDPSEQKRIFERFYRVDKSHSTISEGTGLGLSIVKNAAKLHNAEIELTSELGKGSEISIIFNKQQFKK